MYGKKNSFTAESTFKPTEVSCENFPYNEDYLEIEPISASKVCDSPQYKTREPINAIYLRMNDNESLKRPKTLSFNP